MGAAVTRFQGTLCISESPGGSAKDNSKAKGASSSDPDSRGKSIRQWLKEQDQWKEEPALPPGWIRIKSRANGDVYYFNKATKEATFRFPEVEAPLPAGWTKQKSSSTGRTYYFH